MDALALSTRCPLASALTQFSGSRLAYVLRPASLRFGTQTKITFVLPVCIPHSAPSGRHITTQTLLRTVRDLLVHAFVRIIPGHE